MGEASLKVEVEVKVEIESRKLSGEVEVYY
jgi:hypothetical protein